MSPMKRFAAVFLCLSCVASSVWSDSSSSSASSSSEEDGKDLLVAAVARCMRESTAPLIAGGTYLHLGKIDACVNDGLNALESGSAPADVADKIVDCVNGNTFPDSLMPTIDKFNDCVHSALS